MARRKAPKKKLKEQPMHFLGDYYYDLVEPRKYIVRGGVLVAYYANTQDILRINRYDVMLRAGDTITVDRVDRHPDGLPKGYIYFYADGHKELFVSTAIGQKIKIGEIGKLD